jgi:hypothetical protein
MTTHAASYRQHADRVGRRSRAISAAGRDIGAIPPVADVDRRRRAEDCFRAFCESYFPESFNLAWSPDHLTVIAAIERVVIHNDTIAIAMPRGSGKTTLSIAAVLWATLNRHHRFVMLIGSTASHARKLLTNLKTQLATNDALLADYPEVSYPIRALEGEARRCGGQHQHGSPTRIEWTSDQLVLPTIAGSAASGAVVRVAGIEGNIRGPQHITPEGETIRPTLAVIDDPQTDESAKSPLQCDARLGTIRGAIAGMAGPGQRTAMIVPCTVIVEGDLADQLLDREKNPQWQGQRTKLIYAMPTAEDLWEQYRELREASFRKGGRGDEATEFYRAHQSAMKVGAQVAWPERFNRDDEIDALQHAMNIYFDNPVAFAAEYQNEPVRQQKNQGGERPEIRVMEMKIVGTPRGQAPQHAERLTAFIDVQAKLLWWMVVGWRPGLGGHVIDYGSWPDQGRAYFTKRDAKRTYARELPGQAFEAQLYRALQTLADAILGRAWVRDDGAELRVERCFIDAGWGKSTDLVFQFCRESAHAAVLMPSKGDGLRAQDTPLPERKPRPGVRVGHHWQIQRPDQRAIAHCFYDTNRWKSTVHERLRTPTGDPSALTLCAAASKSEHRMLLDHLAAEIPTPTTARGRSVDIWAQLPNRDNDLLDCLIGNAVAASTLGVEVVGQQARTPNRPPPRRDYRFQF